MATLNKKKTHKNLKSKGFTNSENRSDDHIYLDYYYNDKFIHYTKISRGSAKDISAGLVNAMARQCHLSKKEFVDLARCPMSKAKYVEVLKENGDIDDED